MRTILCRTLSFLLLLILIIPSAEARRTRRLPAYSRYRYVSRQYTLPDVPDLFREKDDPYSGELWESFLRVRTPEEIMMETELPDSDAVVYNPFLGANVFQGYMEPPTPWKATLPKLKYNPSDTTDTLGLTFRRIVEPTRRALESTKRMNWARHSFLIRNPENIEYISWLLPPPPQLPPEDYSFEGYIRRLHLPAVDINDITLSKRHIKRVHWLHVLNTSLQFSQAFLSKNWYQGGNDYLALLFNFYWDVKLNPVYHPNLLFSSTVSYKLGINSASQDLYHKYSISADQLQWNLNFGLKARKKWYYSLTAQFKTQTFNSYSKDSPTRIAAFLSPGQLNFGLGMTYTTSGRHNTIKFQAAISPLSYNLKTCIDPKVDPVQFGVPAGKRSHSEIGSSSELTLDWKITNNISYRSRMFLFTDYKNYQHDWENTFNFDINRFLSTQLYVHLRYDTSNDASLTSWRHWMMKEILSFGVAYSFSTK